MNKKSYLQPAIRPTKISLAVNNKIAMKELKKLRIEVNKIP
jgi:hypothetical protein